MKIVWIAWNIKDIGEDKIEDFLYADDSISEKTCSNRKSDLSSFWKWIVRREKRRNGMAMPEFPEVSYTLGYRTITGEVQEKIIDEAKRPKYRLNPRIWLGVLGNFRFTLKCALESL